MTSKQRLANTALRKAEEPLRQYRSVRVDHKCKQAAFAEQSGERQASLKPVLAVDRLC